MDNLPAIPFVDFSWIAQQVQQLKKRVLSLPEREMRHSVLVEFLMSLSEGELVLVLYLVQDQAYAGDARARELLQEMALEPSAISQLPYGFLRKAYQLCIEYGLVSVQKLFFADPPRKEDIDEAFTQNQYLELPLGVRKQAARTQDRNVIDRLLHDRNWRVIELLLNNPRVVERDVVNIAARRPTRPEILECVSQHSRWSGRYRVRKALACNPYTPYPLARQLLGTLLRQDLKECFELGVFRDRLAEEAEVLLGLQHPKPEREMQVSSASIQEIASLADQFCDMLNIDSDDGEYGIIEEEYPDDSDDLFALFEEAESALLQSELRPVSDEEEP